MEYKLNALTSDHLPAAALIRDLSAAVDGAMHLWPVSLGDKDGLDNEEMLRMISKRGDEKSEHEFPQHLNVTYPFACVHNKTVNVSFIFHTGLTGLFRLVAYLKALGVQFAIVDNDGETVYGSMI